MGPRGHYLIAGSHGQTKNRKEKFIVGAPTTMLYAQPLVCTGKKSSNVSIFDPPFTGWSIVLETHLPRGSSVGPLRPPCLFQLLGSTPPCCLWRPWEARWLFQVQLAHLLVMRHLPFPLLLSKRRTIPPGMYDMHSSGGTARTVHVICVSECMSGRGHIFLAKKK